MSFTEKRLFGPSPVIQTVMTPPFISGDYVAPAGKTVIIKQIVVTNTTPSAANFSMWLADSSPSGLIFNMTQVAANDTLVINMSQVLNSGEGVWFAGGPSNGTFNVTMSGVENDGPLNPLSTYIADDAITTAKIADSSVIESKIANESITNSKISASANISQSKVLNLVSDLSSKAPIASPTFTGVVTAPNVNVTGSASPTNGIYLSNTNEVAISTNGSARYYVDSSGKLRQTGSQFYSSNNQLVGTGSVLYHTDTKSSGSTSAAANNVLWLYNFNLDLSSLRPSGATCILSVICTFSCFLSGGAGSVRARIQIAGAAENYQYFTNEAGSHKQYAFVNTRAISAGSSVNFQLGIYSVEQTINVDQNDAFSITVMAA